eukprot:9815507-Lingulodinium_polyedra.AAC.1
MWKQYARGVDWQKSTRITVVDFARGCCQCPYRYIDRLTRRVRCCVNAWRQALPPFASDAR